MNNTTTTHPKRNPAILGIPLFFVGAGLLAAVAKVETGANLEDGAAFEEIDGIQKPMSNDAATDAKFEVIDGRVDRNGGGLELLKDSKVPMNADEPRANFFFSGGGKFTIDLGKKTGIGEIRSFSWHPSSRSAQIYSVYAANGDEKDFSKELPGDTDPEKHGWTLVSKVDTTNLKPGQHSVAIRPKGAAKSLGEFQHLLFVAARGTERPYVEDTFFSEIDVVALDGPEPVYVEKPKPILNKYVSADGEYTYTVDCTTAPDLQEWCKVHLIPVMEEWYPKIIEMIPVEGITPTKEVTFTLKDFTTLPDFPRGVPAFASGNSVVFNTGFMRNERDGEAVGAGVHEIVHVVQFGGNGQPRRHRRPPTWVTEGVADYIRWFLFEPEKKGAEITRHNIGHAKYDSSYRITANFFKYVIENYEKDLMRKLNVATHNGYSDELWKEWTGKTVQELGDEWLAYRRKELGIEEE